MKAHFQKWAVSLIRFKITKVCYNHMLYQAQNWLGKDSIRICVLIVINNMKYFQQAKNFIWTMVSIQYISKSISDTNRRPFYNEALWRFLFSDLYLSIKLWQKLRVKTQALMYK